MLFFPWFVVGGPCSNFLSSTGFAVCVVQKVHEEGFPFGY